MGSFGVPACADQAGPEGSRASDMTEQQLKLLLEVTNQVVSILDLRDLAQAVSSTIRRVMQCHSVGVVLPEADGKHLCHHGFDVAEGFPRPPDIPFSAEASPAGEVLRTGRPLFLNPIPRERIPFGDYIPDVVDTLVELPLTGRNRTLGVLGILLAKGRSFDADDLSFLGQVANQVAIAIENSLAYREIAELKDKLALDKAYLAESERMTHTGSWAWDFASATSTSTIPTKISESSGSIRERVSLPGKWFSNESCRRIGTGWRQTSRRRYAKKQIASMNIGSCCPTERLNIFTRSGILS